MNTDPNIPITQNSNPTQPVEAPVAPVPSIPQDSPVSETPSVVVPNSNGGVPRWFYFIFGITLIVFFLVTTLLVLQITQKQPSNSGAISVPQISTTKLPTPTAAATDSAVTKLNQIGTTDDIASIEADLKNTELTVLDQSLEATETEVNTGSSN